MNIGYVLVSRMVRMIGDEFLTEERDRKYYADHYTCCPPPLFIILITLVEVSKQRLFFAMQVCNFVYIIFELSSRHATCD